MMTQFVMNVQDYIDIEQVRTNATRAYDLLGRMM